MVVPEGIVAAGAESAIATPEKQNPAIKSATSLMINRPVLPSSSRRNRRDQLAGSTGEAISPFTITERSEAEKEENFECVVMDRGITPQESSNGASGRNIFARKS